MSRYIDADKLKNHYAWWDDENKEIFDSIIDAQPTADVKEVVRGEWVEKIITEEHLHIARIVIIYCIRDFGGRFLFLCRLLFVSYVVQI